MNIKQNTEVKLQHNVMHMYTYTYIIYIYIHTQHYYYLPIVDVMIDNVMVTRHD